jgi:hypothetical protein
MGKLCSLSRHTTFMLDGIANSMCTVVKNSSQHLLLLFTKAEKILKFPCCSCQIYCSNTLRAFVEMVEGSEMSKFGIRTLVQFSYKFLRKIQSNQVTLKRFGARTRATRDVAPSAPRRPRRRTPRHARRCMPVTVSPRPGSVGTVCVPGVTRRIAIGRCHTAHSHAPAPARRGRHWPATPPHDCTALRPYRVSCGR